MFGQMRLPNFLIIGAAKSGTSSLYYYLKQHPQVFMAVPKEPYFFELEGENLTFAGPGDQERRRGAVTQLEDYYELFQDVKDEVAVGEASTTYLDSPKAPERIKHYIPDSKIIAILRNPVDRAYASFLHLWRDGHETVKDFSQALKLEDERIKENWGLLWQYKTRQFTYEKLKRYFDLFDREQIKVYIYEDWRGDNHFVLKDIFQFLGVDEDFIPDLSKRLNVGGVPKNEAFNVFLRRSNRIKDFIKPIIPRPIRKSIQNKFINLNMKRVELSPDIRRKLIHVYKDDILKVQDLIRYDLSHWFY